MRLHARSSGKNEGYLCLILILHFRLLTHVSLNVLKLLACLFLLCLVYTEEIYAFKCMLEGHAVDQHCMLLIIVVDNVLGRNLPFQENVAMVVQRFSSKN